MDTVEIVFLVLVIGLVICGLVIAWCFFMLYRNQWVYKNRTKLIGTPDYNRLPTYNYMFRRWWIWDMRKFLNRANGERN